MKKFLLSSSVLLSFVVPLGASAAVILPNLYAREYCSLREYGVSHDESMEAATSESIVSGDPVVVTVDGRKTDLDVIQAWRAVRERCPQYLSK